METFVRRLKLVLLDRHPLWLSELGQVLEAAGFETVGSTTAEGHALQLLRQHDTDVLVFEPEACTSTTARFIEAARAVRPHLKAIAVSSVEDANVIRAALQSGTWAYVLRRSHPEDIAVAVRQTISHSIFLAGGLDGGETAAAPDPKPDGADLARLTRREREILALTAEGHSNAAMAKKLWVTEQTVKFHLANIYRKLNVPNRTAASRWAHERGIAATPWIAPLHGTLATSG
jgi:DNA-binding NarL/FixJ family response regulator